MMQFLHQRSILVTFCYKKAPIFWWIWHKKWNFLKVPDRIWLKFLHKQPYTIIQLITNFQACPSPKNNINTYGSSVKGQPLIQRFLVRKYEEIPNEKVFGKRGQFQLKTVISNQSSGFTEKKRF